MRGALTSVSVTTLQERLREAMRPHGTLPAITDVELQTIAKVTRAAVSAWFTRDPPVKKLSSPVLMRIAKARGVRPEWLANGDGPMREESAGTAVAEARSTYFGVPNSHEEAEVGREWGKIADDELRAQVRTLIYVLVSKQEQQKTKARKSRSASAPVAATGAPQ
jgi:hypothetical protein